MEDHLSSKPTSEDVIVSTTAGHAEEETKEAAVSEEPVVMTEDEKGGAVGSLELEQNRIDTPLLSRSISTLRSESSTRSSIDITREGNSGGERQHQTRIPVPTYPVTNRREETGHVSQGVVEARSIRTDLGSLKGSSLKSCPSMSDQDERAAEDDLGSGNSSGAAVRLEKPERTPSKLPRMVPFDASGSPASLSRIRETEEPPASTGRIASPSRLPRPSRSRNIAAAKATPLSSDLGAAVAMPHGEQVGGQMAEATTAVGSRGIKGTEGTGDTSDIEAQSSDTVKVSAFKEYGLQRRQDLGSSTRWPKGPPHIKPTDPRNEAVDIYMSIREEMASWSKKHIRGCQAVELFCLSKDTLSPYQHTLTFTVRTEDESVVEAAAAKFKIDFPDFKMPVIFLRGRIVRAGEQAVSLVGEGVGVHGIGWSQGTIGGIIKIGGQTYLTTCHHVTNPVPKGENGEHPGGAMESPGLMSRQDLYDDLARQLEVEKEQLDSYRARSAAGAVASVNHNTPFRHLAVSKDSLSTYENTVKQLETSVAKAQEALEDVAGKTYLRKVVTEPLAKREIAGARREVDWALIELEISEGKKPGLGNVVRVAKELTRAHKGKEYVPILGVDTMKELPIGISLFKRGNKTGVTEGNYDGEYSRVDISGSQDEKNFTTEHSVVPPPVVSGNRSRRFLEPGDSGSWIINAAGFVVGYGWASSDEEPFRAYITSMDDFFEMVETYTGSRPTIPPGVIPTEPAREESAEEDFFMTDDVDDDDEDN